MKMFLEKNLIEINELENKYNYIPSFIFGQSADKSLDSLCLKTTLAIAKIKDKGLESKQMEKRLGEFRKYALKHFS